MPSERARRANDRGMVTAELAACLPVLVLVLAVALTAVSVVSTKVRAQDAAREAARAAARGDGHIAARLARSQLPSASVVMSSGSGETTAVVTARVHPLGGWLPAITVSERAVAALEPGAHLP